MSFRIYDYVIIIAGLFTIYGAIAKPNFYWNSRRAMRLRKIIGDGPAMISYLGIGIACVVVGVLSLVGVISLIN